MRTLTYLVLVCLVVISVVKGDLTFALLLGGAKALLVGLSYMELHVAARQHAVAYALCTVALSAVLVLLVEAA